MEMMEGIESLEEREGKVIYRTDGGLAHSRTGEGWGRGREELSTGD